MAMSNCQVCGKLFNRVRDRVCPACVESEKVEFDKVLDYIRETHVTFISQIAEETEVDRIRIIKWVHEGKLNLESEQAEVEGGCRKCGQPVDSGELCDKCRKKLAAEIAQQRAHMSGAPQAAPEPERQERRGMHHME